MSSVPIIDLQRSLRRLGKIRMGEQRPDKNGKLRPAKRETWRITSSSLELLTAAGEVYGGTPEPWDNPATGKEYSLSTTSDTLRIIVPPGAHAFSQWYEMWSAGGCQRRCDGVNEHLSAGPCQCPEDQEKRAAAAKDGKACKMTTRLSVILPDVPDVGVWMMESHGYYAAVELAGAEEILRLAAGEGRMIPAALRIEQRTVKRGNETRRFAVPVLELTSVTAGMLMTGEAPAAPPRAVAAPAQTAIAAAPTPSPARPKAPKPAPTTTAPPPLPHEVKSEPIDEAFDVDPIRSEIASYDAEIREAIAEGWKWGSLKAGAKNPIAKADCEAAMAHVRATAAAVYDRRRKRALAELGDAGVKTTEARHRLVTDATGGETHSTKKLSAAQLTAIVEAAVALTEPFEEASA